MNPALAYTQNAADLLDYFGLAYGAFLLLCTFALAGILSGIAIAVLRWWSWTYRDLLDPSTWLRGGTPPRPASLRRHRSPQPMGASRSPPYVSAGHGDALGEALHRSQSFNTLDPSDSRPRTPANRFSVSADAGQGGAE